jgi:hypothetical protein
MWTLHIHGLVSHSVLKINRYIDKTTFIYNMLILVLVALRACKDVACKDVCVHCYTTIEYRA